MQITLTDDFDLYKITYSGQCFRPIRLENDVYRFIIGNHILYIKKLDINKLSENNDSSKIFEVSCSKEEWDSVWSHYFDLETNYRTIRSAIDDSDKYMYNCAENGAGIRILNQDKWEMLISFIISQRKSIPAIRSSVEKLCKLYGHIIESPINAANPLFNETLMDINEQIYSFPTPEEMKKATADELAGCGLGYRVPYIIDAINRVNSDIINLEALISLDDESLFDELKTIKGVGDKVANCVCLFAFHRTGRAPVDTWISKVINTEYNGINPFPNYGNVAGIMQQYVFYNSIK